MQCVSKTPRPRRRSRAGLSACSQWPAFFNVTKRARGKQRTDHRAVLRLDVVRCRAGDEQRRAGITRVRRAHPTPRCRRTLRRSRRGRCARPGAAPSRRFCSRNARIAASGTAPASAASACARVMPGDERQRRHRLGDRAQMRRIWHRRDVGDDQPCDRVRAASAPPASPPCRPSNGRAASPATRQADPASPAHRRPWSRSACRPRAGSRHDCADPARSSADAARTHAAPWRNCGRNRTGHAAAPAADRPSPASIACSIIAVPAMRRSRRRR